MFFSWILCFIKKHHFFVLFLVGWIFLWTIYSCISNIFLLNKINEIKALYGEKSYIVWQVDELYKKSPNFDTYILNIVSINNKKWYSQNFLLRVPKNIILDNKQIIWFQTILQPVENFDPTFNYQKFLLLKNIYFVVWNTQIEFLWQKSLSKIENFILWFRENILLTIKSLYPKNEATFLSGILIWERNDIPLQLSQSYNNSGLTHFISISWFHISIIIIFLWFLFQFFPPIIRGIFISICIICFILIVWFKIPAIRAAVMWIVWYFILLSGRDKNNFTLLLFTAFLFVLYNPLYLNYDISFHLSFLAVLGILYTKDFWEKIFFFLPWFIAIRQSFVLTMSAITTTLPIMIINFWQFNIFSPIANMFVWWLMPFVMLFWFLSILWNFIYETFWYFIWFVSYFLLKFINEVALFFWNLGFGIIQTDFYNYWIYFQILYFIIFWFIILFFQQKKNI